MPKNRRRIHSCHAHAKTTKNKRPTPNPSLRGRGENKKSMSYRTASPDRYGLLKAYARENRKNATLAESMMWELLRKNRLGTRFLRQHIIVDYIVDFVSRESRLIIEVDGGYHS